MSEDERKRCIFLGARDQDIARYLKINSHNVLGGLVATGLHPSSM